MRIEIVRVNVLPPWGWQDFARNHPKMWTWLQTRSWWPWPLWWPGLREMSLDEGRLKSSDIVDDPATDALNILFARKELEFVQHFADLETELYGKPGPEVAMRVARLEAKIARLEGQKIRRRPE